MDATEPVRRRRDIPAGRAGDPPDAAAVLEAARRVREALSDANGG